MISQGSKDGGEIKNNTQSFDFQNRFPSHFITLQDVDLKLCFLLTSLGLEDLGNNKTIEGGGNEEKKEN